MGFGGKKFWGSVASIGLQFVPGGSVARAVGGLVLSELLKPDSDEQGRFKQWVEFAVVLASGLLTDDERWTALTGRVESDLEGYYGGKPKLHDVMFNASAALKEARGEFEE